MAEYKKAAMDPRLLAGLVGAAGGAGLGHLTSEMLWKKPSKMQRILTILAGAGVGGVGSAALAGAMAPGPKGAASKLAQNAGTMFSSAIGDTPTKQQWQNMSPAQKGMYGGNFAVDTIKGSLPNFSKDQYPVTTLLSAVTGGGAGVLTQKLAVGKWFQNQQRKRRLIDYLRTTANTQDPTSRSARQIHRNANALGLFNVKDTKAVLRNTGDVNTKVNAQLAALANSGNGSSQYLPGLRLRDIQKMRADQLRQKAMRRQLLRAKLLGVSQGQEVRLASRLTKGLGETPDIKVKPSRFGRAARYGILGTLGWLLGGNAASSLTGDKRRYAERIAELQRPE